ncbi:putative myosin heavy chain, partial [Cucumispora dikerogammari]
GKTENTKKVIQYIAYLDSMTNNKINKEETQIADLIMETTELLEFFGNAKTTRNDNSSRFGKFIKLIFNNGRLVGAKVDKYLLEKGRVTDQNPGDRNYHIFHALVSSSIAHKFHVKDVKSSVFRNKELILIDEEKANEQLSYVANALKKLSINVETVLRIISAIILLNSLEFKEQKEQAQLDNENQELIKKIAQLLRIDANAFTAALIYPKKLVGNEEISYNISIEKAKTIITGFSRHIYERLFDHLIERINVNLYVSDSANKNNFIGILDIAGFEIFQKNSFEQLCINYTNEKLQQYFNHTMFISEQKLYENEGIQWNYIDFGLDLKPTIDLLESNDPIGAFSMLDEESIMPKGNDRNFIEKLSRSDSSKFRKEELNANVFELDELDQDVFIVHHYAGTVNYNVTDWVSKNKDTAFDFFNDIFDNCSDQLIKRIILNNQTYLKGIGKGFFKTVAQTHKAQLNLLMETLTKTVPHFVRCILPNENKAFDKINTQLMLKQLRCNGVLEGIRISRKGYPNRLFYNDFRKRYTILLKKTNIIASEPATEEASIKITNEIIQEINSKEFNKSIAFGRNKIFLKTGALAVLESIREEKIKQFCLQIKPLI